MASSLGIVLISKLRQTHLHRAPDLHLHQAPNLDLHQAHAGDAAALEDERLPHDDAAADAAGVARQGGGEGGAQGDEGAEVHVAQQRQRQSRRTMRV